MAAHAVSRAVKLTGTDAIEAKGQMLRAGPLSVVLENGALRYIKINQVEVIRAIAFLVRDENWGTFTPQLANLHVQEASSGFVVSYDARCIDAKRAIAYTARIVAGADGSLNFEVTATPETDVQTNRTGFIVLHPLKGVAGCPLTIEHVDGRIVEAAFPAIIDPDCPFRGVRALTHEVMPGLRATCRMEGDTFEMEDHRNWTDASFKTYVRPLALPWPYILPAKQTFSQKISLAFTGALPAPAAATGEQIVRIAIGTPTSMVLPRLGLGVDATEASHAVAAAELVKGAGIRFLICQFDGRRGDAERVARDYQRLAEQTGAEIGLEVILPNKEPASPSSELEPIARAVAAAGLNVASVIVSPAPHLKAVLPGSKGPETASWPELARAVRAAFPSARVGGGMLSFFTELNRNPPPAELFDFISHTTSPIVHAADDISVMETLEALPFVVQSTRALAGKASYRVGPSAIPARQNPYGAASAPNPANDRVCLSQMDPRQRGLFGAAWTLGYIAAFAKGGVETIAIGAPTGPSGIIARKTDYAQPYFDGLGSPAVYPVYHVLAGLAPAAGSTLLDVSSSDPARIVAVAHRSSAGSVLWLANLTDRDQTLSVSGVPSTAHIVLLDEESFEVITSDADFLDRLGKPIGNDRTLTLSAYAVARIA